MTRKPGRPPNLSSKADRASLDRFRQVVAVEVERIGCDMSELDEILRGIPYRHALSRNAYAAPPRWIEVQILETLRNEPTRRLPSAGPGKEVKGDIQLCYVSSATRFIGKSELLELLDASRERNSKLGVTGVLLYRAGTFMQILEGPESIVDRVFAKITRDARHRGMLTLLRRQVKERAFADWSMAYREMSDGESGELLDAGKRTDALDKASLPPLVGTLIAEFKRINR